MLCVRPDAGALNLSVGVTIDHIRVGDMQLCTSQVVDVNFRRELLGPCTLVVEFAAYGDYYLQSCTEEA